MSKAAYFISDAHLGAVGPDNDVRESMVAGFFKKVSAHASQVFILGDLFDFWIEYRYAIRPDYFKILHAMRSMVESGVEVHYLAGNHDFAIGPVLAECAGITIHQSPVTVPLFNRMVHLMHGDGILPSDKGYRTLHKVLRSPLNQRLFKLIHPDFGVPFALAFSGFSRRFSKKGMSSQKLENYRKISRSFLSGSCDTVIFGHTHVAELHTYPEGICCNIGDWMKRFTYAKLDETGLTLWKYNPIGIDERI